MLDEPTADRVARLTAWQPLRRLTEQRRPLRACEPGQDDTSAGELDPLGDDADPRHAGLVNAPMQLEPSHRHSVPPGGHVPDWIVAESLERLRNQLNALAPNRSKVSDGGIGDVAHQKAGTSDHLPRWIAGANLVTARDFTHSPETGLDCAKLRDALIRARDSRIRYMIFAGQIIAGSGGPRPWVPRVYAGPNGHHHHLHLSVVGDQRARDGSPWMLPGMTGATTSTAGRPTLRRGDTGPAVELVQRFLGVQPVSGFFGEKTEAAVLKYQAMRGLEPDGVVGPLTWRETSL